MLHHSPALPLPYPLPLLAPSLVLCFTAAAVRIPPLAQTPAAAVPALYGGGAVFLPLWYHASLWAVFSVTAVLHACRLWRAG